MNTSESVESFKRQYHRTFQIKPKRGRVLKRCQSGRFGQHCWVRSGMGMTLVLLLSASLVEADPGIVCPSDTTIECTESTSSSNTGVPTTTNAPGCTVISATFSDSVSSSSCVPNGIIERVWTATDDCGDSAVCTQMITLVDSISPSIICPADTTAECNNIPSPGMASATDAGCGIGNSAGLPGCTRRAFAFEPTDSGMIWDIFDLSDTTQIATVKVYQANGTLVKTETVDLRALENVTVEPASSPGSSPPGWNVSIISEGRSGSATAYGVVVETPRQSGLIGFMDKRESGAGGGGKTTINPTCTLLTNTCWGMYNYPSSDVVKQDYFHVFNANPSGTTVTIDVYDTDGSVIDANGGAAGTSKTFSFAAFETKKIFPQQDLNVGGSQQNIAVHLASSQLVSVDVNSNLGDNYDFGNQEYTTHDNVAGAWVPWPNEEYGADYIWLNSRASDKVAAVRVTNCRAEPVTVTWTIFPYDGTGPVNGNSYQSILVIPALGTKELLLPGGNFKDEVVSDPFFHSMLLEATHEVAVHVSFEENIDTPSVLENGYTEFWYGSHDPSRTRQILVVNPNDFDITIETEAWYWSGGSRVFDSNPLEGVPGAITLGPHDAFATNPSDTTTGPSFSSDEDKVIHMFSTNQFSIQLQEPNYGDVTPIAGGLTRVQPQDVDVVFEGETRVDGSCDSSYSLERVWSASDECGNTALCTQIVSVVDTTPPTITCPSDITAECNEGTDPSVLGMATAIDGCSTNVTITLSDTGVAGSCPVVTEITRVWTVTDDCGLSDVCTQLITLVSTIAPDISCPSDVTVFCADSTAPSSTGAATATNSCSTNIVVASSDSVAAGTCTQEEVITRTWTGTDECGNSNSCEQVITVVDNIAPVITCPNDATVECDASTATSATGLATATDNCSTNITINSSDSSAAGTCPQEEVISRTWTATDECGNSQVCTQTITIVDTTAPVISCPNNTTVECDASTASSATGAATATDNCSTNVSVTFSDSTVAGTCPQEEVLSRTWTVTDECGNSSVCTQTITVVDDTAPVITCPNDTTVECDASTAISATGSATATDNCSTNITINSSDSSAAGTCPQEEVISRTWTATDECGNSSVCTQTITVVDNTAPVITCPNDTTVECDASTATSATGSATATDNCSTNITINSSDSSAAGTCPQEEVISRTWTAADECGNSSVCTQTITVVDNTAPVITCPNDTTVECDASTATSATGSATATDNCSTNITINSSDSSAAGTCPQEEVISRTWTATDECGNSSVCTQTITVVDNTAPVITCPNDTTVECDASTTTSATGSATATDNCSTNVTVSSSDSSTTGTCPQEEVISRTWTATDECGNSSVCTQTITVVDDTAPVITCPNDATIECNESRPTPQTLGTATAVDLCDNDPVVTFGDSVVAGTCAGESVIARTWMATDACGSSVACTQTVTIVDSTPSEYLLPSGCHDRM